MDIEKAKEVLNRINDAKRFDGIYTSIGIIFEAIDVVLNELDNKDKIIDLLLNEVAKEGTPSEFEYRKKRILEICKEKAEGK